MARYMARAARREDITNALGISGEAAPAVRSFWPELVPDLTREALELKLERQFVIVCHRDDGRQMGWIATRKTGRPLALPTEDFRETPAMAELYLWYLRPGLADVSYDAILWRLCDALALAVLREGVDLVWGRIPLSSPAKNFRFLRRLPGMRERHVGQPDGSAGWAYFLVNVRQYAEARELRPEPAEGVSHG